MRTPNEEIVQRGRDPATLFPVCRTVTRVWPWPVDPPPGVSVRDDEAKSGWTEFCGALPVLRLLLLAVSGWHRVRCMT